jgi:hypothetical protein
MSGHFFRRVKPKQSGDSFTCYLDVDDKHPALFGDAILPRDDDGMGFALGLEELRGKWVRITIEVVPSPEGYPETYG